jgi:hypothetical protein
MLKLNPHITVLRWGAFRWLCFEDRVFLGGIKAAIQGLEGLGSPLFCTLCPFYYIRRQTLSPPENTPTKHHLESRNQALINTEHVSNLILNFSASKAVRNILLFINYPVLQPHNGLKQRLRRWPHIGRRWRGHLVYNPTSESPIFLLPLKAPRVDISHISSSWDQELPPGSDPNPSNGAAWVGADDFPFLAQPLSTPSFAILRAP